MKYLLSIKTVFPKPGGRVWYDDLREVHGQIFAGVDTISYAFMWSDPNAADNRWLREAFENRVPTIYFLGVAPGRYQAFLPVFITGWDAKSLKAEIAFGLPEAGELAPPQNEIERRYALGHAIVTNGIPLSKIHHAAFDAHLIGIDPDYRLHVSPQLLDQNDGPMLEGLKKLQGVSVHLPRRAKDYPDRDRLSLRFERFRVAY